jgi:16S rRNA (adenine1518-N6/adenine1519-N6)-dimethyltransferase
MHHKAKKRLGQNFLIDRNIIDKIIDCIHPRPDDCMVEIGPGLGALSQHLLQQLECLHVIELDRDVIPALQAICSDPDKLDIHQCDVLKFDFAAFHTSHCTGRQLRITGNLPYNISTAVLFHLLASRTIIRDMHFMLQKEVVERIAAAPNDSNYGRLSVMMQTWFDVQPLFSVSASCFRPVPRVESAIIRLVPRERSVRRPGAYEQLVKQAFSQRRKQLRNTLKALCSSREFELAGIDPGQRPQELGVADFLRLHDAMAQTRSAAE